MFTELHNAVEIRGSINNSSFRGLQMVHKGVQTDEGCFVEGSGQKPRKSASQLSTSSGQFDSGRFSAVDMHAELEGSDEIEMD